MTYSIIEFAQSLRVDHCKIQRTPDLIFLCGGVTAATGPILSGRDYFYRHLQRHEPELARRVTLAEDVARWFQKDDAFPDLLEMENYLAHLADLVVLFVESPGSIAELGAFAASGHLRPKTLAVLNTSYGTAANFITDGPVRKIRNTDESHLHYYTWNPQKPDSKQARSEFLEISKALTTLLEQRAESRPGEVGFDPTFPAHSLLLVLDLIRVGGVATKSDLTACLKATGCGGASSTINEHLSILQSVGLVEKRLRSKPVSVDRGTKFSVAL